MRVLLERLLVAVIVAAAFLYAVWALVPVTTRRSLAQRLVAATGGPQATNAAARLAQRLARSARGDAHCHGCDAHDDPASPTGGSRP